MRLGDALGTVARVHPHFSNTFYRRVRVIREAPRAAGSAVTVDLTHACPLRCPFCIAAGVLGRAEMPLETFRSIAVELAGVDRLTLVGGEPFHHSEISRVARLSLRAAREVEVFTNGLALGRAPGEAGARVAGRFPGAAADRLTLVLSVDPAHAGQMGKGRLALAVEGLLAAEAQGVCRARFSITHPSLATGKYLDTATIRDAIGEASAPLADLFTDRLMAGTVQDAFYFNPVICARPGEVGQEGAELLRLEDLVFSPEVAITFGPERDAPMRSALASVWSVDPPGATCLADALDRRAVRSVLGLAVEPGLHDLLLGNAGPGSRAGRAATRTAASGEPDRRWRKAWATALADRDEAALHRLLRAHAPFRRIMAWDGGASVCRETAGRVRRFLSSGIGDRALRWGGDEGGGRLDMAVFRELAERCASRAPTAAQLATWINRLFLDEGGGPTLPVYRGEREILGMRTPLAPGETHGLERVHLPQEPGFGARDELVVRPVLLFHPGGRVEMSLPGISAARASARSFERSAPGALRRLVGMIAVAGGPSLGRRVVEGLDPALLRAVAGNPPVAESRPLLAGAEDLVAAFEECTFDRNRQRPDEDNQELVALLLCHAPERFPRAEVRKFTSRALSWLERSASPGLSRATKVLLARVEERGVLGRRLARLLQSPATRPPVAARARRARGATPGRPGRGV